MAFLINRETVKKHLSSRKGFEKISATAAPMLALTSNPNAKLQDLAAIIEKDPELSARLLKIANSGFYGFRSKVESVSHAVVLLGWNAIKMISVGSSLLTRMCATDRRLFNHSMRTAQIARFIATEANFYKVEEIAMVGLLHDFGQIILAQYYPEAHVKVRQYMIAARVPVHMAEREILGLEHGEIGSWVLEDWNMPQNITESVAHHHSFNKSSYHARKTAVLHVADILAFAADYRGPASEKVPELSEESLEILGFTSFDLKEMLLATMKMRFAPIII
jgi:putative nucleotidyltransferase with HDIG domain